MGGTRVALALASRAVSLARLDGQRGALVPWVPVFLGIGIGFYFLFPIEPGTWDWIVLVAQLGACGIALALGLRDWPVAVALILVLAGVALAGLRTNVVAGPVLDWRYYGPVEGRIVAVDRSASDKVRLTLDRVVLERVGPRKTPHRVRVSLHGDQEWLKPQPGQRVMLTAHLGQPQGPVEPGGFDFQRMGMVSRSGRRRLCPCACAVVGARSWLAPDRQVADVDFPLRARCSSGRSGRLCGRDHHR